MPTIYTPSGIQAKGYYNSATDASPTWARMIRLQKLTYELNGEQIKLSLDESQWARILAGEDTFKVNFTYAKKKGVSDAIWTAIMASKVNHTCILLGFLDGLVTDADASGFKAPILIYSKKRPMDRGAAVLYDFEGELGEFYESTSLIDPAAFSGTAP